MGAPPVALYAAATEMCAWVEHRGCVAVVLCEHHGSDDGYLPSPLLLASAIAARTEHLILTMVVILPFYDPIRLAEDMAVLDLISGGRASYVLGMGYRPEEYEHFGSSLRERGRLADEKLHLLRSLLSGEVVVHDERRIRVTPTPQTPGGPALMWGGGSLAAARRAGRYGLGLLANANVPGMQEAYQAACREHGNDVGPTLLPGRDTPTVCFVADDVDESWAELGEYLLHDARMYASWNPDNKDSAGITHADTVAELRETSESHRILSVAEAVARIRGGEMLKLAPLCGGLPPDIAWPYLKRVADVVLPEAGRTTAHTPSDDGPWKALNDLTSNQRT
jgi:alkanesulfonate monooxygenase SsuD/methylene tetrahydromethanopterin reductase-like flavin-dependent oxidoreductase (luciferase family)